MSVSIKEYIIRFNFKRNRSKLSDSYLNGFSIDISKDYQTYFYANKDGNGKSNPVSGATMSAQAGCNAVNCVIKYLKGGN